MQRDLYHRFSFGVVSKKGDQNYQPPREIKKRVNAQHTSREDLLGFKEEAQDMLSDPDMEVKQGAINILIRSGGKGRRYSILWRSCPYREQQLFLSHRRYCYGSCELFGRTPRVQPGFARFTR